MHRLHIDSSFFPKVYESAEITGRAKNEVPIVAGGGDQAAGAIGCGITEPGSMSLSLGTSGVLFSSTNQPLSASLHGVNVFCDANNGWHAMGVMLSCGGCFQWLRRTFFANSTYHDLELMAAQAPDHCDGLSFLPYLTGERCPVLDPAARGAWTGLSASHKAPDLVRSVYEGVTLGIWDMFESLKHQGVASDDLVVTGGGAQSKFWLQMIADATGLTLHPLTMDEGPAFGAAILAGIGVGVWPNARAAGRAVVQQRPPIVAEQCWGFDRLQEHRNRYERLRG
jgi:xylulokinase